MEKWLPDTPDREKWSQEESLTDKDKEAPMAELPGELEDLIGELMEEEEDLFDEMEDVSSSAADSLDKGAGWDAMDGPISNMSAKGVTGNRLPNTSEIGGRSGEGRQGKSSGEFVGDEAVGKGGRKTPSRLTPDPFVKGQIKDHSKDSAGGATGGGKESGQGGEGLEGPLPRAPGQRDLAASGRQAGRPAEQGRRRSTCSSRSTNFHHTDLKKMIEMMAQVERDLKAGRYQNALRQRQVLVEGLGNVKQYLEGEFEVRKDATANLPADIQKEILGSMQDPSPAGWEELNRQYFERLSAGGGETAAASRKRAGEEVKQCDRGMTAMSSATKMRGNDSRRTSRRMKQRQLSTSAVVPDLRTQSVAATYVATQIVGSSCVACPLHLHVVAISIRDSASSAALPVSSFSPSAASRAAAEAQKVVIPFDFVSKFDDGRYGADGRRHDLEEARARKAASSFPRRCSTSATICKSQQAAVRRPTCRWRRSRRSCDDDFGGQIGIWGSVERAAGRRRRNLRPGDQVRRFLGASRAEGDLRESRPAPTRSARSRTCTSRRCSTPSTAASRASRRRARPVRPRRTGRRTRTWSSAAISRGRRRRAQGLGSASAGSSASRWATWSTGCPRRATPRTRSSASRSTANVGDNEGVMYYSESLPGRGRGEVPLPVPLAHQRPGGQGVHQVLRRGGHASTAAESEKPAPTSRQAPRQATTSPRSAQTPRGLSQPAEPQGPEEHLEHAHRGLHAQAHEVHAPLGPRDALRLPRRRARSSSTTWWSSRSCPPRPAPSRTRGTRWKPRSPSRRWKRTAAAAKIKAESEREKKKGNKKSRRRSRRVARMDGCNTRLEHRPAYGPHRGDGRAAGRACLRRAAGAAAARASG